MLWKRQLHVLGWAAVAAQTGFGIVGVIATGLSVGFALDLDCATGPLFTLVMLAISIPISMYIVVQWALGIARQLQEENEQ